jgi:hypothetical protein
MNSNIEDCSKGGEWGTYSVKAYFPKKKMVKLAKLVFIVNRGSVGVKQYSIAES